MECKQSIVFDNHLGFDRCVIIYTSTVYAFGGYVKTQDFSWLLALRVGQGVLRFAYDHLKSYW